MSVQQQLRDAGARARASTDAVDVRGGRAELDRRRRRGRLTGAGVLVLLVLTGSVVALQDDGRTKIGTVDETPAPTTGRDTSGFPTGQGPSVVLDANGEELFRIDGADGESRPAASAVDILEPLILDDGWLRERAGTADETASPEQLRAALADAGLRIQTSWDRTLVTRLDEAIATSLPSGYIAQAVVIDRASASVVASTRSAAAADVRPQAGLAFAPIVVAAAVDTGVPTGTRLPASSEVTLETEDGQPWVVQDPQGRDGATLTMAEALVKVSPTAIASLNEHIAPADVANYALRFGWTSASFEQPVPSTLLGTHETTPLELARAYQAFAGDGTVPPIAAALRATDPHDDPSDGAIAYERPTYDLERAIQPATVDYVRDALRDASEAARWWFATCNDCGPGDGVWSMTGANQHGQHWFVGWDDSRLVAVWVGTAEGNADVENASFGTTAIAGAALG